MPPACSGEQLEEKEFVLQEVSCKNFLDPDGDFRNFDKNFPVGLLKYDSRYPEKFLGRFFPKKNDFIVFRLWKIKIWASWEYSPSSTEFYVSRGTFWGKIFLTENIPSLFVFRVRLEWKRIGFLTINFRRGCQNCVLRIQKTIWERKFFKENTKF